MVELPVRKADMIANSKDYIGSGRKLTGNKLNMGPLERVER